MEKGIFKPYRALLQKNLFSPLLQFALINYHTESKNISTTQSTQ
jgi:hypothetical protein